MTTKRSNSLKDRIKELELFLAGANHSVASEARHSLDLAKQVDYLKDQLTHARKLLDQEMEFSSYQMSRAYKAERERDHFLAQLKRKATDAIINEWQTRHSLTLSPCDARAAFEDAQTA